MHTVFVPICDPDVFHSTFSLTCPSPNPLFPECVSVLVSAFQARSPALHPIPCFHEFVCVLASARMRENACVRACESRAGVCMGAYACMGRPLSLSVKERGRPASQRKQAGCRALGAGWNAGGYPCETCEGPRHPPLFHGECISPLMLASAPSSWGGSFLNSRHLKGSFSAASWVSSCADSHRLSTARLFGRGQHVGQRLL